MTKQITLANQIRSGGIIIAPGVYDALGAGLAERAGFATAYLSGASVAYTRFGQPDIGLVDMTEMGATLSAIRENTDLSIIVDADTGFGNALNVQRTVRLYERSGANGIQLEDQSMPKRCGHLKGKTLVSKAEMVGKIKAAVDARRDEGTLIIARTDAIAVEGFEPALDRAEAYADAGADVLFVEAPKTDDQIQAIVSRLAGKAPLLANMVEGGQTPLKSAEELETLGYKIVIFPGGLVRAFAKMANEYFANLKANGSNDAFRDRMLDFDDLNGILGTNDILARGAAYDASNHGDGDD